MSTGAWARAAVVRYGINGISIAEGHFAAHAAVKFCLLRVTAGMRPRRAYVFVSRQFSNRCGSSGARNTMARLFMFVVILEIFSQCYLAESAKKSKIGCVVCGRKSQPRYFQKAKSYKKEFKCCFGIVGRAIDTEDVICEGCRRAVEEHRRTGNSFFSMLVLSHVITEHLKYPLTQKLKFNLSFFFVQKFVDMNRNQRGRIPKHKRSMLSKEKSDSSSTREMVVVSRESLLEMEEKLRILSASK